MKKNSTLKLLLAITYAAWGLIAACWVAWYLYIYVVGYLWFYIFGEEQWPVWAGYLQQVIVLGVFVLTIALAAFAGLKKGAVLAASVDADKHQKKVRIQLVMAILALIAFSVFLRYRMMTIAQQNQMQAIKRQEYQQIQASLIQIDRVELSQKDAGANMEIFVPGISADQYQLDVEIKSIGYATETLKTFQFTIVPQMRMQSFNIDISFDELGQLYRERIENYVLSFDQKVGIDEVIAFHATLKVVESKEFDVNEVPLQYLPESQQRAAGTFFFSCYQQECVVSQE